MRKVLKVALLTGLLAVSATASVPAVARSDGENGYELACAVLWFFGYNEVCAELR